MNFINLKFLCQRWANSWVYVLNLHNSGEHKSLGFPSDENGILEIFNSCGTVFQNRLMIFGGQNDQYQGIDYNFFFIPRFVYLSSTIISRIKFFASDRTFKKISSITTNLWNASVHFRTNFGKELVILSRILQENRSLKQVTSWLTIITSVYNIGKLLFQHNLVRYAKIILMTRYEGRK